MVKHLKAWRSIAFFMFMFLLVKSSFASELDEKLTQIAVPYVKYFKDNALTTTSEFPGLTRSFRLYLGEQTPADEAIINYGAVSYDQSILARISLSSNTKDILDTYVSYATPGKLIDPNNPLINCNGKYYGPGGSGDPILYGLYRIDRILGHSIDKWYESWDWIVDTGSTACFIIDALEEYKKTSPPNEDYKNFAVLLGGYILRLKDSDGGIRAGPRGMSHLQESESDYFWNLKSTEQNERCLYAFDALYAVTGDEQYNQASIGIKNWLKSMYNKQEHLFHCAATFIDPNWVKSEIPDYLATDVTAFAPLKMMFDDPYFGDQGERDAEVDAMFNAIEGKTGFLDANNRPLFFRFTTSQVPDPIKGDYGSVEWSAQMALAYLRAAQEYATRNWNKTQIYLDKYNVLITSLETFFSAASDDLDSKVAPYASYYSDKSVAWGVPTGTGYYTFNCQAALASVYYAFAKAGYDPTKLGGGPGMPGSNLNLSDMPWYQNTAPYSSTGAATGQMILNFIRTSAGATALTQDEIYEYAKSPNPYGPELNPDEMDKILGHFDPYDTLVSNWSNGYDSLPGGNPYKGYNFSVDTYNPNSDPDALNKYMRDICHWMAYTVTKEDWWRNGDLVAEPNTPAAIPIYGSYNHWVVVKGFSASANPCPEPHTNPWNTPDFTVYGFWIKDPLISGIGQDTYKTAAECTTTYFLQLSTSDNYNGKFVQVAEPPLNNSKANVLIPQPIKDIANLKFIGVKSNSTNSNNTIQLKSSGINVNSAVLNNQLFVKKQGWRDLLPIQLLADSDCQTQFSGTIKGNAVPVKRIDIENSDYYLVPFNKADKKGRVLTSAVIILDADDGYFKEASWTKASEKFLAVDKKEAINLIIRYILNDFSIKLSKLPKAPLKSYLKRKEDLYRDYRKLLSYVRNTVAELIWEPNSSYSLSPYQPYWKIDVSGYIWYVTQKSKVFPEKDINEILEAIGGNRLYLEKFYSNLSKK